MPVRRQVFVAALFAPCRSTVARFAIGLLIACSLAGCVRRRLTVRSNPVGAKVYVDNQQIGTTPCSVDFTYYGTREIRLVKAGFETLTVAQPVPAPWYQIPPLDFVSENVVPRQILDKRTVTYNLAPQVLVPPDQLLSQAEQLRQSTQQGTIVPTSSAPATLSPGQPPGGALPFGSPAETVPVPAVTPPANMLPPGGVPFDPANY